MGLRPLPGGIGALSYPLLLVVAALRVDFTAVGGPSQMATAVLGTIIFVIAAPTSWLFAIDFIEAGLFTVVAVSLLTSFPLWYLVGVRLARSTNEWSVWIARYLGTCAAWTVAVLVVLEVLGSLR